MIVLNAQGNPASAEDVLDYARQCDDEAARLAKRGLTFAAKRVSGRLASGARSPRSWSR